jgi:hypothetical protein
MYTDETRMGQMVHGETTSNIIGAALEVHNTLGYGFLEKVYQQAMQVELIKRGSQAELESPSRSSIRVPSSENITPIFL